MPADGKRKSKKPSSRYVIISSMVGFVAVFSYLAWQWSGQHQSGVPAGSTVASTAEPHQRTKRHHRLHHQSDRYEYSEPVSLSPAVGEEDAEVPVQTRVNRPKVHKAPHKKHQAQTSRPQTQPVVSTPPVATVQPVQAPVVTSSS